MSECEWANCSLCNKTHSLANYFPRNTEDWHKKIDESWRFLAEHRTRELVLYEFQDFRKLECEMAACVDCRSPNAKMCLGRDCGRQYCQEHKRMYTFNCICKSCDSCLQPDIGNPRNKDFAVKYGIINVYGEVLLKQHCEMDGKVCTPWAPTFNVHCQESLEFRTCTTHTLVLHRDTKTQLARLPLELVCYILEFLPCVHTFPHDSWNSFMDGYLNLRAKPK